jgi:hypothetical protein
MPKMEVVKTSDGRVIGVMPDGSKIDIDTPPVTAPEPQKLSPKEIELKAAAEDKIAGGEAGIEGLDRAEELNELARGGPGTSFIKYFDYLTNPEQYNATQELDTVIKRNVLSSLKSTFGTQITNEERQVLQDVEGSSEQPPKVRTEIFKRARKLYLSAVERERKRLDEINTGAYGMTTPPAAPAVPPVVGAPPMAPPAAPPQAAVPVPPVVGAPQMQGGGLSPGSGPAPVRRKFNPATGKIE